MKHLLLLTLTSLSTLQGLAQDVLIPYRVKDKWGYASPDGVIKIAAQYEHCSLFENGYARVNKDRMMGLIDTKGGTIVPFNYDQIYTPAAQNGEEIPAYRYVAVGTRSKQTGIYDLQSRQLVLDTIYSDANNKTGTTLFTISKSYHEKGVFDAWSQQWIAEPIYYDAIPVSGTLVKVEKHGKEFSIPVIAGKPGEMKPWSDIPPPPGEGDDLESGVSIVDIPESDPQKVTPELTYEQQLIKKADKYGFRFRYKLTGYTIPAVYDSIDRERDETGMLAVRKNGKWGVVNYRNAIVLPFVYDFIDMRKSEPEDGFFVVNAQGKKSVVDKKGKVLANGYDDIIRGLHAFVLVTGETQGILITVKGTRPLLIKPQFSFISALPDELKLGDGKSLYIFKVSAYNENRVGGYLSSSGKVFFED